MTNNPITAAVIAETEQVCKNDSLNFLKMALGSVPVRPGSATLPEGFTNAKGAEILLALRDGHVFALSREAIEATVEDFETFARTVAEQRQEIEKQMDLFMERGLEIGRLTMQLQEAQRAVEAIKQYPELTKCQVIHMDYPAGWSCYDDFQQAQTSHGNYSPEFREKLAAGKGLCNQCRLRAIAASQLPRPT